MQTQIKKNPSFQIDALIKEFSSDNAVYGLEFIIDELYDKKEVINFLPSEQTKVDWFGLSDLCI